MTRRDTSIKVFVTTTVFFYFIHFYNVIGYTNEIPMEHTSKDLRKKNVYVDKTLSTYRD